MGVDEGAHDPDGPLMHCRSIYFSGSHLLPDARLIQATLRALAAARITLGRIVKNSAVLTLADAVGRGFIAVLLGTAGMTLSSTMEMKLRGRSGSEAPAQAICKALGIETTE